MNGKNFFRNPMLLVGMLVVSAMVLAACSPARCRTGAGADAGGHRTWDYDPGGD